MTVLDSRSQLAPVTVPGGTLTVEVIASASEPVLAIYGVSSQPSEPRC
jgi:hypothetical protein